MSLPLTTQVSFPQELKPCIDFNQTSEQRATRISDLLVQKATRDKFISWAEEHKDFVFNSPIMQQIVDKVVELEQTENKEGFSTWTSQHRDLIDHLPMSKTVQKISSYNPIKGSKIGLCEEIEKGLSPDKVTPEFVNLLTEYFKVGALPYEKVKEILSRQKSFAERDNPQDQPFKMYLPLLKELNVEQTTDILQVRFGKDLLFLLGNEYNFCQDRKVLCELSTSQLKSILTFNGENGKLVIYPPVGQYLAPFLEKFSLDEVMELMPLKNQDNESPFLTFWTNEESLPLCDKLSFNRVKQLALICEGGLPMEFWKNLTPKLKSWPFEQLKELFALVSFGMNFVLGTASLRNSLKLDQLLEFKDKEGSTFLHTTSLASVYIPLLLKEPFEKINSSLMVENNKEETPLQNPHVFRSLIPFLNSLRSEETKSFMNLNLKLK